MTQPIPQNDPDRAMARLAALQSGVVSMLQLLALGFSYSQIEWRVARGRLHRIHLGVYAVGHTRLIPRGWLIAARLAVGDNAFFSHHTAAGMRKLRDLDVRRIELTIPGDWTPPCRPTGLILHRTTTPIDLEEVSNVNGLPCSTVPRILVERSTKAHRSEIEHLLAQAVRTDQFDPHALEAAMQRHRGRPGVGKLKQIADYYRPLPSRKSELERMFDEEHARRPEIPPCERNVIVNGWEIDCLWREQGVALELDGRRYHAAQLDYEKDRRKDTALQLIRLRPMRVSYWMWKETDEREHAIRNLQALLERQAA